MKYYVYFTFIKNNLFIIEWDKTYSPRILFGELYLAYTNAQRIRT